MNKYRQQTTKFPCETCYVTSKEQVHSRVWFLTVEYLEKNVSKQGDVLASGDSAFLPSYILIVYYIYDKFYLVPVVISVYIYSGVNAWVHTCTYNNSLIAVSGHTDIAFDLA